MYSIKRGNMQNNTSNNMSYRIMLKCDIEMGNMDGQSTHLSELINTFKENGHDVLVICPRRRNNMNMNYRSILVPGIGISSQIRSITEQFMFLFYLIYHVIKFRPHVVYMRSSTWNISGVVAVKILSKPCILEVNGFFPEELIQLNANYLVRKLNDIAEKVNYTLCDKIIVVNEEIKEKISSRYGVDREKIHIMTNKVNINLFKPCINAIDKLGLDRNSRYICYVGNLVFWQGLKYLIEAARYINREDVKYLIVGDGPEKDELIILSRKLDVYDKFIFLGKIPYEKVYLYINASDVCVAPFIKGRYASPLKIFEYMSCGKPFVASNIDGLEDVINDSKGGMLVSPENSTELAGAISILLDNKMRSVEMGLSGRKYILKDFSWDTNIKKIISMTRELLL